MKSNKSGQSLVEIIVAMGLSVLILPTVYLGLITVRENKAQAVQRAEASAYEREMAEATRQVQIREHGWEYLGVNGVFHPEINAADHSWILAAGPEVVNGYTRSLTISDVYRDFTQLGNPIVTSGGTLDPSTKKLVFQVSWTTPLASNITSTNYMSRYMDNLVFHQSTQADFLTGTLNNTAAVNHSGGEVELAPNTKAKWCSPEFSSSTIDLPDGPPVAVDAKSSLISTSTPNDVFVATSPLTSSIIKLAYVNVTANTDPPVSTLRGVFTLNSGSYSNPSYVPTGINLDNTFKTNDVKYYTSASGKTYALMAIDKPDKEVIAILVNDGDPSNDNGTTGEYADPVNKIYKYWSFFNTRIYNPSAGLNTGYTNPSANSADSGGDGNGFESNPTRAYTDNASFAVDNNSGNGTGTNCTGADKDKHRYYNYGFALPSGATINGIEVRLDAKVDNQTGSPKMCVQLSWDGGNTWTSAQSTTTLNTNEVTYTLGGAADTWGRAWNDTNFTNANFRLRVIDVASNNSRDFSLDWAAVKVYYSGGASALNDQAPFTYGATTLYVLGDRGYAASGGYLYVFDLGNIDSKSPGSQLDQVGCRIQLDGYDCQPGSPASDKKYNAGETGTSWSDTGSPAHNDCSDGGNIELYASNDLSGVTVGGHNYIYIAVGAGTNPELDIVDATNVPDGSSSPAINNSSCGRISGGNAGWELVGSYDFNSNGGTEEAANSVYAKSDGTRAYISSNGTTDSKQFYIINTTTKSSPSFLSGSPSGGPTSGYYQGSGANGELYPRRSLTVLGGQRVVLVGKDGVSNGNDAQEYQVLNSSNEATPTYCGGVNFNQGFNDLTSVSEADGDNFVYMVANTQVNELKIIQGGPDGSYVESGNYVSPTLDAGHEVAFNYFMSTATIPANTTITFQVAGADPVSGSCTGAVFNYVGPDGTSGSYYSVAGGAIRLDDNGIGYENPARCFRYKAYLTTTDYNVTPDVLDVTVNYSP